MRKTFAWVLLALWVILAGIVFWLILVPKPAKLPQWLPPEAIRIFFVVLVLGTVLYGVGWVYRRGMNSAKQR